MIRTTGTQTATPGRRKIGLMRSYMILHRKTYPLQNVSLSGPFQAAFRREMKLALRPVSSQRLGLCDQRMEMTVYRRYDALRERGWNDSLRAVKQSPVPKTLFAAQKPSCF